jgi:3-isopropylmalate/(R)-2-methylmalate dehydratase small subunit
MTPLVRLTAIAAALLRENVDTDAIIPSREMTSVSKTGLADGLFAGWRYMQVGGRDPNSDFMLNQPRYRYARILLSGRNFGCGSSREHAVWALAEYGFRAIIAPSFNPIFQGNCIRNGVAPIVLDDAAIAQIAASEGEVTVDLAAMRVSIAAASWPFTLADEPREMLMEGLDAIELTLKRRQEIAAFRASDAAHRPWAYLSA